MANITKYNSQQQPTHFLRLPAVKNRTALSGSSIWAKVKNGTFPKPIKLSKNITAWNAADVEKWAQSLIKARDEMPDIDISSKSVITASINNHK
jgi:prophage regulatory protein